MLQAEIKIYPGEFCTKKKLGFNVSQKTAL